MFYRCLKLETAPELPAPTLVNRCYLSMFAYCSSLKSIKVHFTEWGDDYDTAFWVAEVSSNGIFYCPNSLPKEYGVERIPYWWNIVTF